jgi:hypothetical protein
MTAVPREPFLSSTNPPRKVNLKQSYQPSRYLFIGAARVAIGVDVLPIRGTRYMGSLSEIGVDGPKYEPIPVYPQGQLDRNLHIHGQCETCHFRRVDISSQSVSVLRKTEVNTGVFQVLTISGVAPGALILKALR